MVQVTRRALLTSLTALCGLTSACADQPSPPLPVERLATNVHVEIGRAKLELPFIAVESATDVPMNFSLDRGGNRDRHSQAADAVIEASSDPHHPLELSHLTIVVGTYGWNDSDMGQRAMCPLLTRSWSRSVCDDPWAPLQWALPLNRFTLVDLESEAIRRLTNCKDDHAFSGAMPQIEGRPYLVCKAAVVGSDDFHQVIMRIRGSLGAAWLVWGGGQNGETAENMAGREGEAILAFVRFGIGGDEDFERLHAEACRHRRPAFLEGPDRSRCPNRALASSTKE